ncbi:MAG: tetratricopeptide repeat protein [Abditibacteriales bacterium]|nr:tetratricopeptide repeat protein [Abditibacteriales bacterium]MDW8365543.1 tetratricopeptide repeat protein [Abditibacteriales bacterium]
MRREAENDEVGEEMMICNRCGNRSPLNSKFCRFCGSKLDEPGATKPVPEEEFYVPQPTPGDHERVQRLLDEAFAQSEKGEIGAAIYACKEALVIDPRSVPVRSLLGLLYERVGEKEKAIAEYERVLQLNPDSALEREALARLRGEEIPAAMPVGARSAPRPFPYANTMPIVAAATLGIVIILAAYRAASQTNNRRAQVEPPKNQLVVNVTNYTEQGRQALARGDYHRAAQLFQQALTQNPNDAQAQQGLEQARRGMMLAATPRPLPSATAGPMTPPQQPAAPTTTPAPTGPATPLQPILPNPPVTRNQPTPTRPSSGDVNVVLPPLPGPRRFGSQTGMVPPNVPELPASPTPPADVTGGDTAAQPSRPDPPQVNIGVNKPGAESTTPAEEGKASGYDYQRNGQVFLKSGDYARALQEFERAIAAYQEQQSKGIRVEDAAEGIRTCQRFIEQCRRKLR